MSGSVEMFLKSHYINRIDGASPGCIPIFLLNFPGIVVGSIKLCLKLAKN